MADVRKSAKQTAARARAREKAAQFRATQDKLEELAASYFVATDTLDEIAEATEREIAAVRMRAEAESARARTEADSVVGSMLALGVTRNEVANRLGIAVKDVRRPDTAPVKEQAPTVADPATHDVTDLSEAGSEAAA